jgi:protein-arginine kinase activator protein McsA
LQAQEAASQLASGNRGASEERNRLPLQDCAAVQAEEGATITTACHRCRESFEDFARPGCFGSLGFSINTVWNASAEMGRRASKFT